MGTWGPGNFDGDTPRDYLADVVLRFEQMIDRIFAGEHPGPFVAIPFGPSVSDVGEGCLVPTVAIIIALHENLGADYLPAPDTVERWKQAYLELFDKPNPDFDVPKYKAERRRVIVDTFNHLLALARQEAKTKTKGLSNEPRMTKTAKAKRRRGSRNL
jgi:hypothetical protein